MDLSTPSASIGVPAGVGQGARRGARRPCLWRRLGLCLLALAGVLHLSAFAWNEASENEQSQAREYALKAAMLEKFMKYIEWPPEALGEKDAPVLVGVYGKDPFGKTLDTMFADKQQQAHPIGVLRVSKPEEVRRCLILFVPSSSVKDLPELVQQATGHPVLFVGESPDFAAKGGTINFFTEDKRLRFEVNPAEAKRAKVKISSSLLKLARIVEEPKR